MTPRWRHRANIFQEADGWSLYAFGKFRSLFLRPPLCRRVELRSVSSGFQSQLSGISQGGLAIAGVFACMLFAALSGSSPATVVAIGTIVIAGMRQVGYSKDFAAGVIANAGTLGILIPPSIVMVVYASATDVSVGRMFLAGVIPGLLAICWGIGKIQFIGQHMFQDQSIGDDKH